MFFISIWKILNLNFMFCICVCWYSDSRQKFHSVTFEFAAGKFSLPSNKALAASAREISITLSLPSRLCERVRAFKSAILPEREILAVSSSEKGPVKLGCFWFNSMGFVGDLWVCGFVFLSGISRDAFSSHFVSEIICRQFWVLILVWHILIYLCIFLCGCTFIFLAFWKIADQSDFCLFVWDFLLCYTLRW